MPQLRLPLDPASNSENWRADFDCYRQVKVGPPWVDEGSKSRLLLPSLFLDSLIRRLVFLSNAW
jgi:hypothetical protein